MLTNDVVPLRQARPMRARRLLALRSPMTRSASIFVAFCIFLQNFLKHAAAGTYSGTKFHRIIPGFAAQAGDPTGTGKGGEAADGGFVADEFSDSLSHSRRGVLSMAKPSKKSVANGSQFFVTLSPQPHLDGTFTVIGSVIGGEDALARIEDCRVTAKGRPATDEDAVTITTVTIHANPFATA